MPAAHQFAPVHDVLEARLSPAPRRAENLLREQFQATLSAPFKDEGDIFRLAVTLNNPHHVIGEVLLKIASRSALQGEVGYIFNPTFSGQGYATEAVARMIEIGFSSLGFHRIFARLDTRNHGSVGVVERLGLRREAHLLQNDRFNDEWGDEYIYAVLAAEWLQHGTDRFLSP